MHRSIATVQTMVGNEFDWHLHKFMNHVHAHVICTDSILITRFLWNWKKERHTRMNHEELKKENEFRSNFHVHVCNRHKWRQKYNVDISKLISDELIFRTSHILNILTHFQHIHSNRNVFSVYNVYARVSSEKIMKMIQKIK